MNANEIRSAEIVGAAKSLGGGGIPGIQALIKSPKNHQSWSRIRSRVWSPDRMP